jgi:hypothetical protein
MPLDLQRLARVRAHLVAATALVTAGCGGSSPPEHTINEPVHINRPPDPPPEQPPDNTAKEPVHVNVAAPLPSATPLATPTPSATPSATPVSPDPIHINRPNPNR